MEPVSKEFLTLAVQETCYRLTGRLPTKPDNMCLRYVADPAPLLHLHQIRLSPSRIWNSRRRFLLGWRPCLPRVREASRDWQRRGTKWNRWRETTPFLLLHDVCDHDDAHDCHYDRPLVSTCAHHNGKKGKLPHPPFDALSTKKNHHGTGTGVTGVRRTGVGRCTLGGGGGPPVTDPCVRFSRNRSRMECGSSARNAGTRQMSGTLVGRVEWTELSSNRRIFVTPNFILTRRRSLT